jgi:hypothetical protein
MQDRSAQLRLWLLALTRLELRLRGQIAKQRTKFILNASKEYPDNGQVPAWVSEKHKQEIRIILSDHYKVVIPHFGRMVLKQIKSRRIERKAAENMFTAFMGEWVTTEALRKATMISATDYDDVTNAIRTGIEAGEGTDAIARNIRDISKLTPFRSATVARTETHNAATFGSIETARTAEQKFGVQMYKVWLPTLDDRTRPEHRAMATRDPISLNEKFQVGGDTMDRPGDPSASPDNVINCRCALAYEEKE